MSRTPEIPFDRELFRGNMDLMALSVLAEGPRYGYLIQKQLRESSGNLLRVQAGTLYPLLHRLEAEGWIRSRWEEESGRRRKWYELTASGRRQLAKQARQWHRYAGTMRQLLGTGLGLEA